MVRHNRIDDVIALFILFGDVRTDLDMRAFLFVIDCLAYIMQQSRALCKVDVQTEFCRHHAGKLRHFDGMFIHVLAVTRAVFQSAEQLDQFRMKPENTDLEHSGFAVFLDLLVEFLFDFFDRLFDPCGMNPSVADQFFKRNARNFSADGIKPGKDHDFGRIVYDQLDPRSVFQSADISALAADDTRFHVIVGQRDDGNRNLRRMIGRTALDRKTDDLFRVHVRFVFRLLLDVSYLNGNVLSRLVENIFRQ